MVTKSRLYVILIIGVFAVLSVAVVLTAITVSHSDVFKRSTSPESNSCQLTGDKLRQALGEICETQPQRMLLNVNYRGTDLSCDKPSTKETTSEAPTVKLQNAEKDARYTLLMLDPDAPGHSMNQLTFWLHWAVTDIKGLALGKGVIEGANLMVYAGPTPPQGTGQHRYQLIVFESTKQDNVNLVNTANRKLFSLDEFVTRNKLCNIVGLFQYTVTAA